MKNKQTYGILALGIVAILGIGLVAAYHGDYNVQGPNYSEDRHEEMESAFDSLDYDAWVSLMNENGRSPRVLEVITEDNFEIFVEAHEAMESGNFERAAELRTELGLNNGIGPKDGSGFGNREGFRNKEFRGQGSIKGSEMRGQHNCFYSE